MANNDQKQQIDDNVQDAEIVSGEAKPLSASRWLWLAVVVVLMVSLLASWFAYQQTQKNEQLQQQQILELNADTDTIASRLQQSQQQLDSLQQQQQRMADQLEEVLAREQLNNADLLRRWALQEIKYLLNIANQRALLAHDVKGAQQALTMADKQLETLSDYRLHPLRALIAEDLMALDALSDLDIAGMALKLQVAANRVNNLRVNKGPKLVDDDTLTMAEPVEEASWKQAVSDIWQQLRSLVVIRHDQSGESAVLVPEQRYFLYQNLRLQLESARLALLSGDANSYKHSLETSVNWLNRYFIGNERDAILNTLSALQQQDIEISIPDISASLNWLEEYQQ
jgi:uroporphyrin-3 C-methyltransferase